MSLVDVDSWITEYDACERLSRDIQSRLVLRDREARLSEEYSKISATIRIRLKQFSSELNLLNNKLQSSATTRTLTVEELERRQRQIETLQSKLIQLQTRFSNVGTSQRTDLLKSNRSRLWDDDDGDDGDDDHPILSSNENYTAADLRQQQVRILEDQNAGLDALSKVIGRQKDLAIQIGSEVDTQNDIIDDLAVSMERTDMRVNSETNHIDVINRKDASCGYWVVIICLFVAICIVALV